ncbi:MAG TPA: C25 family cysteine peptidase [Sedimentisphaerales bacterium]|jgi:hypothetical protein|nr:C25 family cysteine peptidase [Sedimentisphaerales bacterium]HNU31474.1 C25 family cysteine peptidase [Sedimentisphaerales bacterium]
MLRSVQFSVVGAVILGALGTSLAEERMVPPLRGSSSAVPGGQGLPGWQNGRQVRPLTWTSPDGRAPGTYREYLESRPLTPGRFDAPSLAKPSQPDLRIAAAGFQSVSILADRALSQDRKVSAALDQYRTDLVAEGYTVYTETVSGGTPQDIRSWVRSRYAAGSRMIVFVGDITAAWAQVPASETSAYPCDLYYMDVDGYWGDANADGVFDVHNAGTGDEGPEVCVARIDAHLFDYASEETMVSEYFAKAHRHRLGALTQPWRAIEYIDEDWFDMDVFTRYIFGANTTRHDLGYYTTGEDYLHQLSLGQYYVQVCNHGSSGGHSFGTKPTESVVYAHTYIHSPSATQARVRLGADDGIKVWWNGGLVLTKNVEADWKVDEYYADVQLNRGWNRLLCKVSQKGGDFQLSARVTSRRGEDPLPDLQYRVSDPDTKPADGPFIRGWLVNGFHQDASSNFWKYIDTNYLGVSESSMNPTVGQVTGGKTWTAYSASGGYVDFESQTDSKDYGACYAFASVTAETACSCQMWMGYDDGAKVWLNGNVVIDDNRYGGYTPDRTKVNVSLKKGQNRLLVKVTQWTGDHGFSLRFCKANGGEVAGLTYAPTPDPVTYIALWAVNGPYANEDKNSRLSRDYLGNEASVRPSLGDSAPLGAWELALWDGLPFDIGQFYNHGGWVYPEDIQQLDPSALFYNLFVCGAGRFTDENFLAASYLFHTTQGLSVVASSKTGSMLSFDDFTRPLGDGKTVGESFFDWFTARAPFEDWERSWFYGMVLLGDPTLHLFYGEVREPLPFE